MPILRKEFLDIKANIECGFTLKHAHDMIRTYKVSYKHKHTYTYLW